jgi:hypothetical protein
VLLLPGPSRTAGILCAPLGCAMILTGPIAIGLVYYARRVLAGWQYGVAGGLALMVVGAFLYVLGKGLAGRSLRGLAIDPVGLVCLDGTERAWVISWGDLERVELIPATTAEPREHLKLSARGGGKSEFVTVEAGSIDTFEVSVDSRLVREPLGRLEKLVKWYRDHPESHGELGRRVCIRHRAEVLSQ